MLIDRYDRFDCREGPSQSCSKKGLSFAENGILPNMLIDTDLEKRGKREKNVLKMTDFRTSSSKICV